METNTITGFQLDLRDAEMHLCLLKEELEDCTFSTDENTCCLYNDSSKAELIDCLFVLT